MVDDFHQLKGIFRIEPELVSSPITTCIAKQAVMCKPYTSMEYTHTYIITAIVTKC